MLQTMFNSADVEDLLNDVLCTLVGDESDESDEPFLLQHMHFCFTRKLALKCIFGEMNEQGLISAVRLYGLLKQVVELVEIKQ